MSQQDLSYESQDRTPHTIRVSTADLTGDDTEPSGVILQADNPRYPDIRVPALSDLVIWGVATRCLHHV